MSITTFPRISSDGAAPARACPGARAAYEADFALAFGRVYRFVAARVASRELAELATRRALTNAAVSGLLSREAAPALLNAAKAELARLRRERGADA